MGFIKGFLVLFSFGFLLKANAQSQGEKGKYYVEAYRQDGDPNALILKIKPVDSNERLAILEKLNKPRQEEEDEDEPNTTPFIPQIIPGLTKIFNGIISGNLNEIVHGGTSFAPKNVTFAIDTAYNNAVGLPPPTVKTKAPLVLNVNATTIAPVTVEVTTIEGEDEGDVDNTDENEVANEIGVGKVKRGRTFF